MSDFTHFRVRAVEVRVFPDSHLATQSAAEWLLGQCASASSGTIMLAGGNTPLALYDRMAAAHPPLNHFTAFALDEYVGVPLEHPRNCANLIRARAIQPWGIPETQYHWISSLESAATASIAAHEAQIHAAGGLDLVILGLGQNGHIGFNEPGSRPEDGGRLVPLSAVSVAANREWFGGEYGPSLGVTTGMRTLLAARRILLLAFGAGKAQAVAEMLAQEPNPHCPASFLQHHPATLVILDSAATVDPRLSHIMPGRS